MAKIENEAAMKAKPAGVMKRRKLKEWQAENGNEKRKISNGENERRGEKKIRSSGGEKRRSIISIGVMANQKLKISAYERESNGEAMAWRRKYGGIGVTIGNERLKQLA